MVEELSLLFQRDYLIHS